MSLINYLNLIQEVDELVRGHQIKRARTALLQLTFEEIPATYRSPLAALARRCNLQQESLKILWPNIHETSSPSQNDMLEYAGTLRKMGLVHQSLQLLSRLPDNPEQTLAQAFCYIHQWNYSASQSLLEKCLSSTNQEPRYHHLVKVNLAACLSFEENYEEALGLLEKVKADLKKANCHLYLNALEIQGTCLSRLGRGAKAKALFEEASKLSQDASSTTHLFIEKGRLLNELASHPADVSTKNLTEMKTKIRQLNHWESLRDFDIQTAFILKDNELVNRCFFGTPFIALKEKIRTQPFADLKQKFLWQDTRHKGQMNEIDLYRLDMDEIAFGMTIHRLLLLLASDFYRPFSVARIFDCLFPEEIYDPFTSDQRIHQIIFNLRRALSAQKQSELIECTDQGYRIRPIKEMAFFVYPKMQFSTSEEIILTVIEAEASHFSFRRQDIEPLLPLSSDQWQRALKKLEDQNKIQATGRGKGKLYHLKAA